MIPPLSISRKLFVSHFVAVLVVTCLVGSYFYISAHAGLKLQLQERLKSCALLIAGQFEAPKLMSIEDEGDVGMPIYEQYLDTVRQLKRTNPDYEYIYIMRLDGDKVYFVIDSDESEEQALPGREYVDTNEEMLLGFQQASVDEDVMVDEWGTFLSGYAPIVGGEGKLLIGIDMLADEMNRKMHGLRVAGLVSLCVSILFAWGISEYLASHFKRPIDALIAQCKAISSGDLDSRVDVEASDEMGALIFAVNKMSSDLQASREENIKIAESLNLDLDPSDDDPDAKRV